MLLDDPSPLVRYALADALGASADAPAAVVHALVNDQPDIATLVLERSPLLLDSDLVDSVAVGGAADAERDRAARDAAALGLGRDRRSRLGGSVPDADRERQRRHRGVLARPHRAALRPSRGDPRGAACLGRPAGRDPARAGGQAVRDARRLRGRAQLAGRGQGAAHRAGSLREGDRDPRGDSNSMCRRWSVICARPASSPPGLVLRSLLSGNIDFFEQALAELADLPARARQRAAARPPRGAASRRSTSARACRLRSIRRSAPRSRRCTRRPAAEPGGATRLKRRMVERVLTSCAGLPAGDVEPLMMLLRRYATEAAREEARLFCDELVETGQPWVPANDTGRRMVVGGVSRVSPAPATATGSTRSYRDRRDFRAAEIRR